MGNQEDEETGNSSMDEGDSDEPEETAEPRYKLIGAGGYAKVYMDLETREVLRYQKKYREVNEDTVYLDHCMMLDLAVSQGFNTCEGMPYLHRYEDHGDQVVMHMRDHGINFYEIRRRYWSHEIAERLAGLLLPVVQCCMMLYDNGIQHTDIKPTNVMACINLDDQPENGTLIDFNSVSLYVCGREGIPYWTYGIGTWNYVAPEVLCNTRPDNTSMCWSLGLLISYMLAWHPYEYYPDLKKGEKKEPSSRKFWSGLLKKRRQQSGGSPTLVFSGTLQEKLRKHDPFWWELVRDCLTWDPKKRPSIHHVYARLAEKAGIVPRSPSFFPNYIGNPGFFEGKEQLRQQMVDRIYHACEKAEDLSAFVRAVSYLDRLGPEEIALGPGTPLDACCLLLAWMLENRYVMDDSVARRVLLLYWPGISLHEPQVLYDSIMRIGERLGWRLLQITADVILAATLRPKNGHALLHAYLRDSTEPYTQRHLSSIISASIPPPLTPAPTTGT